MAEAIGISHWDLYGLLEKGLKKRTPRFPHECPREGSVLQKKKKEKELFWGMKEEKMVYSISHMLSLKPWCDEQLKCPLGC